MAFNFIPARLPIVNPDGTASREFYLLLQSLFTASGQIPDDQIELVAPASNVDALVAAGRDGDLAPATFDTSIALSQQYSALAETAPVPVWFSVVSDDVAPSYAGLRDEIAALRREIEDLRKGTVSL